MAIADFIHLKVRSAYSLTEGAIKLDKVVALAKAESMPAVAVTDRNNLFGALEFGQYAAKAGIQPIIGCDIGIRHEDEGGIAANEALVTQIESLTAPQRAAFHVTMFGRVPVDLALRPARGTLYCREKNLHVNSR